MIENMFSDTLWIYTAIAGSIFGALFIAYMRDTRIALWVYGKWDGLIDYCRDRWGWTWLNQDLGAWRKVNPDLAAKIYEIEARIEKLEEVAHPPIAPGGATEILEELSRLKKSIGKKPAKPSKKAN